MTRALLVSEAADTLRPSVDEAGRVRILLADGQSLFREAVRVVLSAEDDLLVVAEAGDAVQALAEAERTVPDLALLDACASSEGTALVRVEIVGMSAGERRRLVLDFGHFGRDEE